MYEIEKMKFEQPNEKKLATSINLIGSIPDFHIIFDVLNLLSKDTPDNEIHYLVVVKNKFGIRTEEARGRFLRGIRKSFWDFQNDNHETLIRSLFLADGLFDTKTWSLFWMMGINDILFKRITKGVLIKAYYSSRIHIANDDVIAYVRHMRESETVIQKWSDATIKMIPSKYFTFLKKAGILKGVQKKEFRNVQVDDHSIVFFIYLIKAIEPDQPDIFKNRYVDYLFMEKSDLSATLKKAMFSDYFDIHSTGMDLKVDLKLDYGELVHAISSGP